MISQFRKKQSCSQSAKNVGFPMKAWLGMLSPFLFLVKCDRNLKCYAFETSTFRTISFVTGANGYLGKEIVRHLLQDPPAASTLDEKISEENSSEDVFCLVRSRRVENEQKYWTRFKERNNICPGSPSLCVVPYNMLDGGESLKKLFFEKVAPQTPDDNGQAPPKKLRVHVYHVASVFGPTENHEQTALDNVKGTKDLVRTVAEWYLELCNQGLQDMIEPPRIIFTSSMAAVRATGQIPSNEKYYTCEDWNNVSKLGENWGSSYQWSKAESERVAWEECWRYNDKSDCSSEYELLKDDNRLVLTMTSVCPSFIFGPVDVDDGALSSSYSIQLVRQWMEGKSPVQSRLCVDVRDAAKIHIEAARRKVAENKRYICSCERRIHSEEIGKALKEFASETSGFVHCDTTFTGGAIPIGEKEVDAAERLKEDLGIICRPVEKTFSDMAMSLSC